ncbi:MAG: hypothetical protein A2741_01655 [Candidatus Zambryskibacteria bacterium RIFCSPHIGHO2_01_FULL_43_27]|uniref:Serine protease n=1 Tax=Candidatus Zambryskibacteria bacterium RIFCSPLOWO2_01_FULL_43_17 TaxID=1802760 RepID=A0A1G2U5R0_9BACT|nr:MAG: hypothetical protein A2741_01655 [Candidatus Zambryskibacteria bacterium RIFCSPHIGHO2_01_FULL_43_27]OHA99459.1 MAG: hypothetical protein A3E93_02660 [Candidatus Zambryskibacteria bacterium RIFCSPHIGHO2_12_FULL_43_12b]OHB04300.1 MAG: hypothetical protein A2920_03250 [Candidatus Zambryskibacteria bacterium RIFCSPLOWO2_01_FULL_43_17]
MEELNKNQLILLTLLVSFVTSIATGIITTSLLQQAPPSVTQVINRVVEKTIEQVAIEGSSSGETVREVTVVVKEEDLVLDAISSNTNSTARITDNSLVDGINLFYGMGVLINKDGTVISARRDILNPNSTYTARFGDGSTHQLRVVGSDVAEGLAVFSVIKDQKNPVKTLPATLGTAEPQLGQSVITLDGRDKNTVSIGRIVGVNKGGAENKDILSIETDIATQASVFGAPLVNLSGDVIGLRVSHDSANQTFVPAFIVKRILDKGWN